MWTSIPISPHLSRIVPQVIFLTCVNERAISLIIWDSSPHLSTLVPISPRKEPMIKSVDTAVLHSPQTAAYLANADRRIVIGFRAALEMLGIALPEAALRRPYGRSGVATIMRAYNADNKPRGYDPLNDI